MAAGIVAGCERASRQEAQKPQPKRKGLWRVLEERPLEVATVLVLSAAAARTSLPVVRPSRGHAGLRAARSPHVKGHFADTRTACRCVIRFCASILSWRISSSGIVISSLRSPALAHLVRRSSIIATSHAAAPQRHIAVDSLVPRIAVERSAKFTRDNQATMCQWRGEKRQMVACVTFRGPRFSPPSPPLPA